jgi:hypothetical protein
MSELIAPRIADVWLRAEFKFRTSETLKRMMSMSVVGGILTATGIWLLIKWVTTEDWRSLIFASLILLPGVIAFCSGMWQMIGYIQNRVDELEISTTGVKYDGRLWDWQNVRAVRMALVPHGRHAPHIRIWTKNETLWPRGGIPILIDQAFTQEYQDTLMSQMRTYFKQRGLNVVCEAAQRKRQTT